MLLGASTFVIICSRVIFPPGWCITFLFYPKVLLLLEVGLLCLGCGAFSFCVITEDVSLSL